MVTFIDIPSTTRVPFFYMEFDSSAAREGIQLQPYRLLVVGQKIAAGTVAELVPTVIRSGSEGHGLFGAGSQLAHMLESVFENQNEVEVTAVAIDDAGGAVAATHTIQAVGTATDSGSAFVYVGGRRYAVAVASGDTAATVAAAIDAAVTADTLAHVTSAVVTDTVTFTAKNGGTLGSSIDVRVNYFVGENLPPGITFTIVQDVVSGATDPDLDEVWAPLGDVHYNTIASAFTDTSNLNKLKVELDDRYTPTRALDSVGIVAVQDTQANLITLANPRNDRFISIMGFDKAPTPAWKWTGAIAAQVVKSASTDPARPLQSLILKGILAPLGIDAFTLLEQEQLLADGVAIFNVNAAGDAQIARLSTTYKTTLTTGVPDTTFADINTALTLGFYRWSLRTELAVQFDRHKLAGDGGQIPAGQKIVTPNLFKAAIVGVATGWRDLGLMEDLDAFKASIVVVRDAALDPNRLDVSIEPDLVNQFRVARISTRFKL